MILNTVLSPIPNLERLPREAERKKSPIRISQPQRNSRDGLVARLPTRRSRQIHAAWLWWAFLRFQAGWAGAGSDLHQHTVPAPYRPAAVFGRSPGGLAVSSARCATFVDASLLVRPSGTSKLPVERTQSGRVALGDRGDSATAFAEAPCN